MASPSITKTLGGGEEIHPVGGGGEEIRTPDTVSDIPPFQGGPFDRSGTPPPLTGSQP